jgi:hypothetical protein
MSLCPNHHVLFDRGTIYVTDDLCCGGWRTGDVTAMLDARHDLDGEGTRRHPRWLSRTAVGSNRARLLVLN